MLETTKVSAADVRWAVKVSNEEYRDRWEVWDVKGRRRLYAFQDYALAKEYVDGMVRAAPESCSVVIFPPRCRH